MSRSALRRAVVATSLAGLTLLPTAPALAHGEAGQGDLALTIGFVSEPAYAGMPNGVQVIAEHGGDPVTDLKSGDLRVEISFGDETSGPMDLEPAFFFEGNTLVFGEPGDYHADFVPSQPGKYTFHVTGKVDGENVDVEMTSGPETFAAVEDVAEASFPAVQAPSNDELAVRIDEESERAADGVAAAEAAAAAADDAASSARTIGVVGAVLGVAGVVVGGLALAAARRKAA